MKNIQPKHNYHNQIHNNLPHQVDKKRGQFFFFERRGGGGGRGGRRSGGGGEGEGGGGEEEGGWGEEEGRAAKEREHLFWWGKRGVGVVYRKKEKRENKKKKMKKLKVGQSKKERIPSRKPNRFLPKVFFEN